MKPTFQHNIINGFALWLDNYLLSKGEAYKNYTTAFYNYTDSTVGGGKIIYGSPYKQWVYNKDITGATIPSGLTINGTFRPTGYSGLQFDFENGRAIFNSGFSAAASITGTYSVKEFNTYLSVQNEESLIIDNKYRNNSRYTNSGTYISPNAPVTPAIFFGLETSYNDPFALGGEDVTTLMVKAVVFAEGLYQLDGALGILSDAKLLTFNQIPMAAHPLGEFGMLKSSYYASGYSYSGLANQYLGAVPYFFDIKPSKIKDDIVKELNPGLFVGLVDFTVKNHRYPRS